MRCALIAALLLLPVRQAAAELKVRSPIVTLGEVEFEQNGLLTFDRRGSPLANLQSDTFELGYGVVRGVELELEAETAAGPDSNQRLIARTVEATVQLLPQGAYWLDAGIFAEVSNSVGTGLPNAVSAGPLVQKQFIDPFGESALATANVLLSRQFGHGRTDATGLFGAAQYLVLLHPLFQPGVEAYYAVDDVGRAGRFDAQQVFAGPAFTGSFRLHGIGLPGAFKYEAGYMFGATAASFSGALRWRFEYEISF